MEVVLGETLSSDVRDGTGKLEREKNKNRRRKLVRLSLLEMGLDFNFPAQLVFQAFLLYLGLEQDFQGHDEMVFLQASQGTDPRCEPSTSQPRTLPYLIAILTRAPGPSNFSDN